MSSNISVRNQASEARLSCGPQVLCVDDDQKNLFIMTAFLSSEGYSCRTASDGAEALSMLRDHADFDLVITDLVMPGVNGQQLCEAIERDFPGLNVIVVSGSSEQEVAPLRRCPAVREVLAKPLRRRDIVSVVRGALTSS